MTPEQLALQAACWKPGDAVDAEGVPSRTPEQWAAQQALANSKCAECGHVLGCHGQDGCSHCGCGAPEGE